MATVGERIRTRREELGWTQEELAKRAKFSKSFLSDVENGKRNVGADKLLDIARALNRSLDYLMMGKVGEVTGAGPTEVQIPKSLAKFASGQGISFGKFWLFWKCRTKSSLIVAA